MKRPSSFWSLLISTGLAWAFSVLPLQAAEEPTRADPQTPPHSTFFSSFSTTPYPEKYTSFFSKVTKRGSRNGLIVSLPTSVQRHAFKDFSLTGTIEPSRLEGCLESLEAELRKAIRQGGAQPDAETHTHIADRPIYLLAYLFADGVHCRQLTGFTLFYQQETSHGAIDVFVARNPDPESSEITLVCAAHEAAPPAQEKEVSSDTEPPSR